ncbi:MAG: hypothetical protein ACREDQ_02085 [Limisphaerales bacterium]
MKVLKTDWFPEFGRAFLFCSVVNVADDERRGESFIVKVNLNGQASVFEQALFTFKLPGNLFDDESLFNRMTDIAKEKVYLEVDRHLLKAGRNGYAKEMSSGLQSSSLSEFIVAMLLGNQRELLVKLRYMSEGEVLSKELANFFKLKGCHASMKHDSPIAEAAGV